MDGFPEVRSEGAIRELLQGVHQPVVFCGHTHIPRVVELTHGQLIVNPGSIGVPAYDDVDPVRYRMQTFSPHACYGILEKDDARLERFSRTRCLQPSGRRRVRA